MNKRIEYIDVAKAIGILLVILGHCYYTATVPYLGAAIYSFHMPMFFIISGMFLKPMGVKEGFAKYSKAYVKPYIITGLLMLLVTLLLFALKIVDSNEFILDFERIAFGSGSNEDKALLHDIPTVGPIWFLLALFWGCLLTSVIKKKCSVFFGIFDVDVRYLLYRLYFFEVYKAAIIFPDGFVLGSIYSDRVMD